MSHEGRKNELHFQSQTLHAPEDNFVLLNKKNQKLLKTIIQHERRRELLFQIYRHSLNMDGSTPGRREMID
jgi:hypothetical protein